MTASDASSSDNALSGPPPLTDDTYSLPSTPMNKRTPEGSIDESPDGEALSNKRQKTAEQIASKPTVESTDVMLLIDGRYRRGVPLLNFLRLAPEKAKRLSYEVCEGDHRHYKLCIYDASSMILESIVEQFAGWITHGHLFWLTTTATEDIDIYLALKHEVFVDEDDYRDELVDTWVLWLRDGNPSGSLNVRRLQRGGGHDLTFPESTLSLMCALVLWHDARSALVLPSPTKHYSELICEEVRTLTETYFFDKEPKDPLELSDKQFCDLYHAHHRTGQPCYKSKRSSQDI